MSAESGEGAAAGEDPRLEVSVSVLRERYAAGDSAPTIATGMGLTSRQVYLWMQRAGIARRPTGAPKWEGGKFPISSEELRRRYEAGASMAALARALEVSDRAVKLRLLAAGTTLRQRGSGSQRMVLPVSSQELRRRYEAGASLYDLAIDLDVAVGTVETRVLEAGGRCGRSVGGSAVTRWCCRSRMRSCAAGTRRACRCGRWRSHCK